MLELTETSAFDGCLPRTIGTVTLSEMSVDPLTHLQPLSGRAEALAALLQAELGVALPKAGRATGKAGGRVVWFGRESYMMMGLQPTEKMHDFAGVTDQSDAWATVELTGDAAEAVLTRLVPVDLRGKNFKRGHTCRTLLGHVNVSILRLSEKSFQIMAFRSMAQTLLHDLEVAAGHVAARAGK